MTDKFKHFDAWRIRMPDGTALDLNTEEAADYVLSDYVLSLIERVGVLEARVRKRTRARSRSRKVKDEQSDG